MTISFSRIHHPFLCVWLVILAAASTATEAAAQRLPTDFNTRAKQQAEFSATLPTRISMKLLTPQIATGSQARIEITLLNRENQPVASPQDWQCAVSILYRSGKTVQQSVSIAKGQHSGELAFVAEEAGLVVINAKPESTV